MPFIGEFVVREHEGAVLIDMNDGHVPVWIKPGDFAGMVACGEAELVDLQRMRDIALDNSAKSWQKDMEKLAEKTKDQ